ncbi:MAG TPA: hypothetical protein VHW60_12240 [Caulobacteraceae bacterium]|jgi:hypothetical protein|nr:hypothetical protein [Caulobacteraceae bacterium]
MRFWLIARPLALAALLPALSGCVALGSFEQRATTFNRNVADTQNVGLLLNLARASRDEPLYFTSTSGVHGSGSEDFSLNIGGSGPAPLDGNTGSSFDTDVLSSKDFYSGMLTPLGPADVNLLFSQGYSREMVLYLVVDRLKVTDVSTMQPGQDDSKEPTSVYFNDPRSPSFATFKTFVDQAMLHGLTTEVTYPPAAAPAPLAQVSKDQVNNVNVVVSVAPDSGGDDGPYARLCYDLALATPTAKLDFTPESPLCGVVASAQASATAGPASIGVKIGDKKYEIVVYTRSIFGIFKYLGGLIGRGETGAVQLHHYPQLVSEQTFDGQLLTVVSSGGDCFTAVSYRGRDYCVPNQGADNTKDIFNILDALLALKTSPGDLPATPTVRITP